MFKLCALVLLLSSTAYSQENTEEAGPTLPLIKQVETTEEYRMHMGINLGINSPEGSRGSTPELALDLGYQPLIPFGVGVELSTSRFDGDDDEYHKRTTLLIRGTYNFGGDIPVIRYSYFGIATGPVFLNDGTEFGLAPVVGLDVPLDEARLFSLGFVAKYLFVTSKDPDSLITSAAMKYWY